MISDPGALKPSRTKFRGPDVEFGEFNLPPGHPRWSAVNVVDGDRALIAFPGSAVEIRQVGRGPVVADPTRAVAYAPGTEYRRTVVSPDGDRCTFVAVSRELAAEAAVAFDEEAHDAATYRFPFTTASLHDPVFLLKESVRAGASGTAAPDALRESLYWLVGRTISSGYGNLGRRQRRTRPGTDQAHQELVDGVRRLIGAEPGARTTLDDLAAALHTSPFHLSRTFRRWTGCSIHTYRTRVRLRVGLDRIAHGDRIADVALELGFASQSHFTDRLRRDLKLTPDSWRRALSARHELSRILKESRIPAA